MLLPFRRSLSLPLPLFFCSFLRGDIISNGVDLLAELSLTQPVPVFLVSPLPLFPDHPQRVSSPRCSSPCSSFSPSSQPNVLCFLWYSFPFPRRSNQIQVPIRNQIASLGLFTLVSVESPRLGSVLSCPPGLDPEPAQSLIFGQPWSTLRPNPVCSYSDCFQS